MAREGFRKRFEEWRERWEVARFLYVNNDKNIPDKRLLLNLDSELHIDLAHELLRALKPGDALMPELSEWAKALIRKGDLHRLSFETYEREVE